MSDERPERPTSQLPPSQQPAPELPPGVDLARGDVTGDPDAAIARGLALMEQSGEAIVAAVAERGATYIAAAALRILDAWGALPPERRAAAGDEIAAAARVAQARVVDELRTLLTADVHAQARTPLEVVRTLRREPTATLSGIGVPAIVRDAFEERSLPDDVYGLAPRTLADLGDDAAAPMMLAWGVGKATVLRAEAAKRTVPGEMAGGHPQRAVENLSISRQGAERQRDDLGTMGRRARSAFDRLRRATRRGRA